MENWGHFLMIFVIKTGSCSKPCVQGQLNSRRPATITALCKKSNTAGTGGQNNSIHTAGRAVVTHCGRPRMKPVTPLYTCFPPPYLWGEPEGDKADVEWARGPGGGPPPAARYPCMIASHCRWAKRCSVKGFPSESHKNLRSVRGRRRENFFLGHDPWSERAGYDFGAWTQDSASEWPNLWKRDKMER